MNKILSLCCFFSILVQAPSAGQSALTLSQKQMNEKKYYGQSALTRSQKQMNEKKYYGLFYNFLAFSQWKQCRPWVRPSRSGINQPSSHTETDNGKRKVKAWKESCKKLQTIFDHYGIYYRRFLKDIDVDDMSGSDELTFVPLAFEALNSKQQNAFMKKAHGKLSRYRSNGSLQQEVEQSLANLWKLLERLQKLQAWSQIRACIQQLDNLKKTIVKKMEAAGTVTKQKIDDLRRKWVERIQEIRQKIATTSSNQKPPIADQHVGESGNIFVRKWTTAISRARKAFNDFLQSEPLDWVWWLTYQRLRDPGMANMPLFDRRSIKECISQKFYTNSGDLYNKLVDIFRDAVNRNALGLSKPHGSNAYERSVDSFFENVFGLHFDKAWEQLSTDQKNAFLYKERFFVLRLANRVVKEYEPVALRGWWARKKHAIKRAPKATAEAVTAPFSWAGKKAKKLYKKKRPKSLERMIAEEALKKEGAIHPSPNEAESAGE